MKQRVKLTTLLAVLFVSFQSLAQISFYRVYSGNGYDRGEGICQLPDSSYLVTGTSSSFGDAPSQAFIMHVDSLGDLKWSKSYGGSESEWGRRIMAVPGYGYYVAGTSSSSGSGNFDNYLFFTDTDGNQQWETFTDNGGWERIHDAVKLKDTSIFTVGETDAGSDFVTNMYLCRYKKNGDLMWDLEVGSPDGSDVAYTAEVYTDTSVLVAGTYYVTDSLQQKAYLALYHIDGSLIWKKIYGEYGNYCLRDISVGYGKIKAVGECIHTGQTEYDGYNIRADENGVMYAANEYISPGSVRLTACVQYDQAPNGNYFTAEQVINSSYPTFEDGEDVYIQRSNEDFYWDNYGMAYAGVGQDQVGQMIKTSDGYAIAVGFHTTYGEGGNSAFLVKLGSAAVFPSFTTDPEVTDIVHLEENGQIEGLSAYPNPVKEDLTVNLPETQFTYVLQDISGRTITTGEAFGITQLSMSNEPAGVYLLQIVAGGKSASLKIVR